MARWADLETTRDYLATSTSHMRRLVHERTIPFSKLGGLLRFDLDEIDAWLKTEPQQQGRRSLRRVS